MEERKVNGDSKISRTEKNGVTIFLIPFFEKNQVILKQ